MCVQSLNIDPWEKRMSPFSKDFHTGIQGEGPVSWDSHISLLEDIPSREEGPYMMLFLFIWHI